MPSHFSLSGDAPWREAALSGADVRPFCPMPFSITHLKLQANVRVHNLKS